MLKRKAEKEKFNKIIRLIGKDAQKGLECFYEEYGKIIYLTAKTNGCSHEKANIVINTVLIKIWQKAEQISNVENPKAWVSTVAKNCAKDELNEAWGLELKEEICASSDGLQEVVGKNEFDYLLSPLKDDEKDLFVLRFVVGCTFQEIADFLKKPLPTITTTYYRALEKIKNFLKKGKNE
ncbi:MAG: sigma-70 family RNA polymerase sigma factor [Clostridia bacterium]|nr:sigma-70 family RNA polymerase sigma factor [Clostridia bacterium]